MRLVLCSILAMLCFGGASSRTWAIPAITCHCFTERTFDPARPFSADPYFLATAQNSFCAVVFAVEKKAIVLKKQKGTTGDDLWIAYWLAARSGKDPESLLQERKGKGWQRVAASLAISDTALDSRVAAALKRNASDEHLAEAVVDELLLRFRVLGETDLAGLRKAGAGNQELILSGVLASRMRQPALPLYSKVKQGSSSWGALLQQAGLEPATLESEFTTLIKGATLPQRH